MNPRGISIAGLAGIVIVLGTGMAALKSASVLWTNAASTVVLALFLSAVVGAIYLRGADRAYWVGFAVFGWGYLVLVNWTSLGGQFGHDLTGGLDDLAETVIPLEFIPATALPSPNAMEMLARRSVKLGNFVQIGRLVMALLFAVAGGIVTRSFALRSERPRRDIDAQAGPRPNP
jgi:hypothetical protein